MGTRCKHGVRCAQRQASTSPSKQVPATISATPIRAQRIELCEGVGSRLTVHVQTVCIRAKNKVAYVLLAVAGLARQLPGRFRSR